VSFPSTPPPARNRVPVERRVVAAAALGLIILVALASAGWYAARVAENRHDRSAVAVDQSAAMVTLAQRITVDVNRLGGGQALSPRERADLRESIANAARALRKSARRFEQADPSLGLDGSLPEGARELFTPHGGNLGESLVDFAYVAEELASPSRSALPEPAAVRTLNEKQAGLVPLIDELTRELTIEDAAQTSWLGSLQLLSLFALAVVAGGEVVLIFLPLARALGRQRQETEGAIAESRRRELALTVRMAEIEAIGEAVGAVLREEDAREAVVQVVHDLTGAPVVSLLETSPDGTEIVCTASAGITLIGMRLPVDGSSLASRVLRMGVPMFIPDVTSHRDLDTEMVGRIQELVGEPLTQSAYLPILRDGRPIAELVVNFSESHPGNEDVLPTLSVLAAEAALAIRHQDFQRQLELMARRDPLTGLDNRRAWQEGLREALARSSRTGDPVCVAMLDLDRFKAYNDTHGHAGGDELLVTVSDAWRGRLREGDVLARLGGEEFGVLLTGCEVGAAVGVVELLRAQVPFGQRCSAGLAQWDGIESSDELLAAADAALYSAKAAGRDQTFLRRSHGDVVAARHQGAPAPPAAGAPAAPVVTPA
jgi:diguanylate cyclase (GGDEF)-like protein